MKPIIITGPTASGKTSLSIALAKAVNGEIISADSMQIYKVMDIGTAKVTKEEMDGVRHHLLDIVSPLEPFTVCDYRDRCLEVINKLQEEGKTPIIVGGTGLYINSILFDMSFAEFDPKLRDEVRGKADTLSNEELHLWLEKLNPKRAAELSINDRKRVTRAIEIVLSGYDSKVDETQIKRLDADIYVISGDREILYDRINKRVDIMIENGLIDEVKRLVDGGATDKTQSFGAISYKETYNYLQGKIGYEELIDLIKQKSRNYAKRQLTWFRRYYKDAIWLDFTSQNNLQIILDRINNECENNN